MSDKPAWFKRIFLHNLEIKIVAIVLAIVTWYAVRDATSFEMVVRDVKIDVQLKDGMAVLHQSASTVDVTFRGSQDDIQRLGPKRIRVTVDLRSRGSTMTDLVVLTADHIEGARGVNVVDITPHRILFSLDREDEKRVPVHGHITGKPLAGDVDEIACDPPTVLIKGPAQKLQVTEMVYTQPVDVDGRIASFVKRVAVVPPGDNWMAHLQPTEVQVKVSIMEKASRREWRQQPVAVLVPATRSPTVDLSPGKVNVLLTGPAAELQAINDQDMEIFVDCAGLASPARYDLPVRIYIPGKTTVTATADPPIVQVTVRGD